MSALLGGSTATFSPANLRLTQILAKPEEIGLSAALSQVYVDEIGEGARAAKQRVEATVDDIKRTLCEAIRNSDWMGPTTKIAAENKVRRMRMRIGYPDAWRDYSKLEIESLPFVRQILATSAHETELELEKIGKSVDQSAEWPWEWPPYDPQAGYVHCGNELIISVGMFPLLDLAADDAIRYARRSIPGHELTHPFDPLGWQYDAEGNLNEWCPLEDQQKFHELLGRIVGQFDGYAVDDLGYVDGSLTAVENVADLGGLEIAYAAFRRAERLKSRSERNRMVGGYTPQQLFFLAYAQIYRIKETREVRLIDLGGEEHSPNKFRVNGPLSNMPEFASAFAIRPTQAMVRSSSERIRFWARSNQNGKLGTVSASARETFKRAVAMRTRL